LAGATPEALAEGRARVERLHQVDRQLQDADRELTELKESARELQAKIDACASRANQLSDVRAPDGLEGLWEKAERAEARETELRALVTQSEEQCTARTEALRRMPARGTLEALQARHRALAEARSRLASEEEALQRAAEASATTLKEAAEAAEARDSARAERNRLLQLDAAYHAGHMLKSGDVCPVCGERLTAAPNLKAPAGLDKAEARLGAAERAAAEAARAEADARAIEMQCDGKAQELRGTLERLAAEIEGELSAEAVASSLQALALAERELEEAAAQLQTARKELERAASSRRATDSEIQTATSQFDTLLGSLGALGAPSAGEGDLPARWAALQEWAAGEARALQQEGRSLAVELAATNGAIETERQGLRELCEANSISLDGRPELQACVAAITRGEERVRQLENDLETAASLRDALLLLRAEARTAEGLAKHLGARGFERWYLVEAIRTLVEGASHTLRDLSAGQFSLCLDERGADFQVIDHVNADERRMVKTLSGGETFLASLSLALALSEHVAELSPRGAARLEALFLDEGFGTLDPETLETVAAALEELGARGRMVGVVTHVAELAERFPVRFDVRREGRSSRVERSVA
jgi:exonuclease SbcC